jgi:hypothetical protein
MGYYDTGEWDGCCNMCGAEADRDEREDVIVWTCPNDCGWSRNRIFAE